ncbi:homoserine dehydrogenase [Metallumcola ferriviriculae]|uniref:Homoserine dehydrogenase n=1 Tax=Metallumcola ferriviriculae TaxID=3039180 RepID=A0AAU0URW8_9FIRM|nr:homoserine dehydrogenase [Desulfitibacteraceae bacterium MK1]
MVTNSQAPIKVGMLGMGTVGRGVYKILTGNADLITARAGRPVQIEKIVVRDTTKSRGVTVPDGVLTADAAAVLENPDIDIVVELMGGNEPAKEYILKALKAGKQVVTANKDLIAGYGKELFDAEKEHDTDLMFEASVAGGIPIIRPLKMCLAGNKVTDVMGIINGTTNYILTKMTRFGSDFNDVLKEAQALGYAESDPTADVEGHDAARKIAILASIAFNTRVTSRDVYVEGITRIDATDIKYATELGYIVKLLGIAKERDGEVEVRVHPVFIPGSHPLAAVSDANNAIFVAGDAVGETMFYGPGAGEMPTASAVVGDIMEVARNITGGVNGRISCTCFEEKPIKPIGLVESKYYLRLMVKDRPGVLASIASVLGNHNVSIDTVLQKRSDGDIAEVVLIIHRVEEQNLRDALTIMEGMSITKRVANVIRVEGEDA